MILSSISLNNIRVHQNFNTSFAGRLNYIVGGNGLGKTTILEAIYYLCTTKSCSASSDIEALSFDKNEFMIEGVFSDLTRNNVRLIYSKSDNKKQYLIDDKKISRFSSAIGKFPVVLLMPSDHSITQGPPAERRKFVDSIISQANKNYLETLIEYNRILKQRSSLLFRNRDFKSSDFQTELQAWTSGLVEKGTELINYRIDFIKKFRERVEESYKKIMNTEETPEVYYSYLEDYNGDNIRERFLTLLNDRNEEETIRGTNLVGPHRDDFIFELNGLNLKTYGSQGQHKTFQAALRFAEFFYLKEMSGTTPIFLLDDVFGELDANRANKISEYLSEVGQAFITITDFGNFSFLKTGYEDSIIRLEKKSEVYA
ncbi:MAG TPA: DNA replication and repair protein RecF [Ignavibacteriaceae bacterium]